MPNVQESKVYRARQDMLLFKKTVKKADKELSDKNMTVRPYLNGFIDKETSEQIYRLFLRRTMPWAIHKNMPDLIFMKERPAIPDYVICPKRCKKLSPEDIKAAIDLASRVIEVYDHDLFDEIYAFAEQWEKIESVQVNIIKI